MKLFAIQFSLLVTLLFAGPAFAEEWWGEPPAETAVPQNIRGYEFSGHRMVPGGNCEKILIRMQEKIGRDLTYDEITTYVQQAIIATTESLVPVASHRPTPSPSPSPSPRSFSCFTRNMLVLTPTGERPIGDLQVGDEVISYEFVTKKIVVNKIFAVSPADHQLVYVLSDLPRKIEVTPRHQFLTDQGLATQFRPIEEIGSHENVFSLKRFGESGVSLQPLKRGRYERIPGSHRVFDLQLIGEPRNFIIEGIIVHNVIIKC